MKTALRNTFVPHNDHIPHLFKEMGVFVLVSLLLAMFVLGQAPSLYLSDQRAAVLPAVLVDLANADRQQGGLGGLTVNPRLQLSAQAKANHMAANGYFAHHSPDGISPWFWIKQAGYTYQTAGENLAVGFFESDDVEQAWMNSQTHRANILNNKYTEVGIAVARGTYQGVDTIFVVQHFGRPAVLASAPANAAPVQNTPVMVQQEPTVTRGPASPSQVAPIAALDPEEIAGESETDAAMGRARIVAQIVRQTETMIETDAVPMAKAAAPTGDYASFADELRTEPRVLVNMLYLVIGFLVALIAMVMLLKELKMHHIKHVVYAFSILLLIVGLMTLNQADVFASVTVL